MVVSLGGVGLAIIGFILFLSTPFPFSGWTLIFLGASVGFAGVVSDDSPIPAILAVICFVLFLIFALIAGPREGNKVPDWLRELPSEIERQLE